MDKGGNPLTELLRLLGHALGAPLKLVAHLLMTRPRAACAANVAKVNDGDDVLVCCGGGGVYFFWQIGAVKALMEIRGGRGTTWAGSSAGALCATMALCRVDTDKCVHSAFELGNQAGLFTHAGGGFGVLGKVIRSWLVHVLPDDAAARCDGRLSVQVTVWRGFRGFEVRRINRFADNDALIDALMCSLHIPFFLDNKMWATLVLDGDVVKACDGSIARFLPLGVPQRKVDIVDAHGRQPDYLVTHTVDDCYRKGGPGFVDMLDKCCALEMVARGYEFTRYRLLDEMRIHVGDKTCPV